ncbi:hypothetical protein EJ06DRAFT_525453 [Trichodelitschia bisporula]|uniref:Genetic interactor of prohibitins 3, mitochondrial n=1 Tax=Trichodelitschia bisporula TaxID=703511 RepID=A0A6G1I9Z2_9PEZI|nr:hypothetical protein EJ06DRAFT_525453 [Trichodelitschia bisporula]
MKLNTALLTEVFRKEIALARSSVPLFLCPALARAPFRPPIRRYVPAQAKFLSTSTRRTIGADVPSQAPQDAESSPPSNPILSLPLACPGCGAPSQIVEPDEAGFYTLTRGGVRRFLGYQHGESAAEDQVFSSALENVPEDVREQLGVAELPASAPSTSPAPPAVPICDRCHNLIHHRTGVSIAHPSLDALEATLSESPHKRNHIFHVIDAADFPMSLIPNIQQHLSLAHIRSRNRRSKTHHYAHGREAAEMSFIITRSDLLAAKKEHVDTMMPVLQEILRDALGKSGHSVRLGKVRCVSAKRGWWTKDVKEAIWERGGGNWFVGQVNVGKSNLFEAVFPKGRGEDVNLDRVREEARKRALLDQARQDVSAESDAAEPLASYTPVIGAPEPYSQPEDFSDTDSLLPPPQQETKYPVMPVISELPGTTASPIRVPFGNGRGELVDLPGLERKTLEAYVKPENKLDLIMQTRLAPERIVVKPGSSVLLGGLVRITPTTPDQIFMIHPFVPLQPHLTSTEKAELIQTGQRETGIPTITDPSVYSKMASAGRFRLTTDVTRKYAGPLTRKDDVGLKPERLPFAMYATDILIAGCGWVEIVAQVRRRQLEAPQDAMFVPLGSVDDARLPEVEVFSPEGKGIGQRRSLSAWLVAGPKGLPVHRQRKRQRLSMRSVKARRAPGTVSGGSV